MVVIKSNCSFASLTSSAYVFKSSTKNRLEILFLRFPGNLYPGNLFNRNDSGFTFRMNRVNPMQSPCKTPVSYLVAQVLIKLLIVLIIFTGTRASSRAFMIQFCGTDSCFLVIKPHH